MSEAKVITARPGIADPRWPVTPASDAPIAWQQAGWDELCAALDELTARWLEYRRGAGRP